MSFRKIDLLIGRHMSAKRWIVVYSTALFTSGIMIGLFSPFWVLVVGIVLFPIALLGIIGHVRRL